MAQRCSLGLPCSIASCLHSPSESKEPWSRPVHTGDGAGDLGEGAVPLATPRAPLVQHDDAVARALPFADEHRARCGGAWRPCDGSRSRVGTLATLIQEPAGRCAEAAEAVFLDPVGDDAEQQGAAYSWRWADAAEGPPALLQCFGAEGGQLGDGARYLPGITAPLPLRWLTW